MKVPHNDDYLKWHHWAAHEGMWCQLLTGTAAVSCFRPHPPVCEVKVHVFDLNKIHLLPKQHGQLPQTRGHLRKLRALRSVWRRCIIHDALQLGGSGENPSAHQMFGGRSWMGSATVCIKNALKGKTVGGGRSVTKTTNNPYSFQQFSMLIDKYVSTFCDI